MVCLSIILERQSGEVETYLANNFMHYYDSDDDGEKITLEFYDSNGCYEVETKLNDDDNIMISPFTIKDDDVNDKEMRIKKYDDIWAFLHGERSVEDVR